MIDCRPMGFFSWDFELTGEGHVARLGFGWPTEQGWLVVDGRSCEVEKLGFLSGRWQLTEHGRVRMSGQKLSAFNRRFEITTPAESFVVEAASFAFREMRLSGPGTDAVIAPAHPFTRRATIRGRLPDFEVSAFAFWLSALTWRRAANNAAAG